MARTETHRDRSRTTRRRRGRGRLDLEQLEGRRVLSANAYIYGIADNNTIWEVDVAAKSARAAFDAKPQIGSGNSNAFAYDTSRSQFFFIDPQNQLQFWDRGSTLAVLADHDQLGIPASGNQPCNAAYYADAYWYFTDGTNLLNRVSFTYADEVPSVAGRETFVVADAPTLTNTFGDIAIDANTGVLYASNTNGAFYSVNLAAPETSFRLIRPPVDESPGLQLSFDSDYKTLYGQSFTGGQWYTVNTATGENTPILGFTTVIKGINGLRDIGGGADTAVMEGDLAIAKSDGAATYVPGRPVTYTITVTNAGSNAVTGARVRDVLPADATFVSATGGATYDPASKSVRYTAGTLAPAGTASFTITILPAATRTANLVNTATVMTPPGVIDLVPGNNSATDVDTPAPVADLAIAKTDGSPTYVPGRSLTYTITVTNAGPSAVTGATVADVLPADTTFVSATGGATYDSGANTVRYTAGTLAPSGTTSFTVTLLPAAARTGNLVNTATVSPPAGVTDPTSGNNSATDTDTPAFVADLAIAKTDGSPTYVPGRSLTYTITVTNAGPSAVTGATVADVLPADTTFVSATGGATYESGANTVRYTAGTLAPSGTASFTVTLLPAAARTGNLVNTATVSPPAGVTDPTSGNNSATDTDTPAFVADLAIAKTDGSPTYVPGRAVTYTITVTNAGPGAVTGATVADVLPTDTTFVSATGGATYDSGANTVRYTAGTLAPSGTTSFTVTLLPAATRKGTLVNTATVSPPAGVTDPTSGNNSATDTDADSLDTVVLAISDVGCDSTPVVTVIDAATGNVRTQFQVFETAFRGGLRAALGDLDNDGIDEIVAAPGPGRPGEIRVFTLEGVERPSFRLAPFGAAYRDGLEVAIGDVNGDGLDEVVAAKSRGAGEVVILASGGLALRSIGTFTAFARGFQGGATVAVADMGTFVGGTDRTRPDGRAEVIVGSGVGMAPTVMVFDVSGTPRVVDSFRPLSAIYQAGFSLSAQRINADQIPDLVVAAGRAATAAVEVYDGVTKAKVTSYQVFASLAKPSAQVYAAAADLDGDGWADEAYMTQGTGGTLAGVQRLRVQAPTVADSIATSLRVPLRIVTRGPRRLAG